MSVLWSSLTSLALGWGSEGHRAIAALAARFIAPETRNKVAKILASVGDADLLSISNWADEVVEARAGKGPLRTDPEAQAFNKQFPNNPQWHFVNLPLGVGCYAQARRYTSEEDVVHIIERCVTVLESPRQIPGQFTRAQALRLLVHLVGDIHQPLHCGTGFYRLRDAKPPQLVTDPQAAFGLPNDRGGNDLFYGPTKQLHALWDIDLVERIESSSDYHVLTNYLGFSNEAFSTTPGDYHHWPEKWAVESLKVANAAYAGIEFDSAENRAGILHLRIRLPLHYQEINRIAAVRQLARAAAHLAALLDRIKWPPV